ncbi:MAG: 30S ribosomal protein S6 [Actinobacteria bacterium]|nr:30S ribosomal protein S6 [Actinomycetota bacterium]
MREYEVMLILPAEADEALVATAVDRIAKAVSEAGGEVTKTDRWGRRRFAFEIDRQNEGYYVVVQFTAEPSTQVELERALSLADEVIRFKVLLRPEKGRHDKAATARHDRAVKTHAPAPAVAAEAAPEVPAAAAPAAEEAEADQPEAPEAEDKEASPAPA